ncbi:MAG TPA: hypothetical protein PKL29_01180, partial [Methanothrix sp.]|nr:hypothetical protein [Methanothrix sp.]
KGALINFSMDVTNNGDLMLSHVYVEDALPEGLTYNSASTGSYSSGQNVSWSDIGPIDVSGSKSIWIKAKIDGSKSGKLTNNVDVDGQPVFGENVTGHAQADVVTASASINVTISAFPPDGVPDTEINYTIVVTNNGSTYLCNVLLKDVLPEGIEYLGDDHGGVLNAKNRTLMWKNLDQGNSMAPGEKIVVLMNGKIIGNKMGDLDSHVEASAIPRGGGEMVRDTNHAMVEGKPVPYVITKTSDKSVYRPGEEITYTITVCNRMKYLPLEDVVVKDVFKNPVEILYSYPEPSSDGTWYYESVEPGGCIEIVIVARVPEVKTTFDLSKSEVAGKGFVNVHNDLSTAIDPYTIVNCVYVTARVWEKSWPRSTCASVTVEDPGTELETRTHGSGSYSSDEMTEMKWENKSIESRKNISASYHPTSFELPGNIALNYSSKWTDESRGKNYITGTMMHETYRYATDINRESYIKMDRNGSKMMVDSSFSGKGSLGFYKKSTPADGPKIKPIFESQEDYSGKFRINETFEEYGSNIDFKKLASGEGYVASDQRTGSSQRTYESGTGSYRSEELVNTFANYIGKEIDLAHRPSSYNYTPSVLSRQDLKWSEGMWSKNGISRGGSIFAGKDSEGATVEKPCNTTDSGTAPASLISERYSSLEYLKKDSVALGLNEMKSNATFQGIADFSVRSKGTNATSEVDEEERYVGAYSVDRHILITGASRYDTPHITVTKEGVMKEEMVNSVKSNVADYTITVTNDGNRALAPIYIWDSFPPGTEYISSSAKPSQLSATVANWTLLHLGIGNTVTIKLKLNITENAPNNVINRVTASGITGTTLVSSSNFTIMEFDYLSPCPPKISIEKKAKMDKADPSIVHYTIWIWNNASSHMAAKITDEIAGAMSFLQSSSNPYSIDSNYIHWSIDDLAPGEMATIEYSMRALRNGAYTSKVHVDASAVDGSGSDSADTTSYIEVSGT